MKQRRVGNSAPQATREPGEEQEPGPLAEFMEDFEENIETIGGNLSAIGNTLGREDKDLFDAATIALDALAITDSFIPGLDVPYVSFERVDEEQFDELEPVPGLDDLAYEILPWVGLDPFDCEEFPESPICDPTGISFSLDFEVGVNVAFTDCEICAEGSISAFGVEIPVFTVCYRRDECIEDPPGGGSWIGNNPPYPIPEQSENSFNCSFPRGDLPLSFWVADSIEEIIDRTYFRAFSGAAINETTTRQIIAKPGLVEPATEDDIENLIEFLEGNGWELSRRDRSGTWISEERNFSTRVPTTRFVFRKIIEESGLQFGRPETSEFLWSRNHYIYQFVYSVEVREREHIAQIIANHPFSVNRPSGVYRYISDWQFDRSPRAVWSEIVREGCAVGIDVSGPTGRIDPPLTPTRRREMACCRANQDKLDYIIHRLGLRDLPFTMNPKITTEPGKTEQVQNLVGVLGYGIRNILETLGQFPIELDIVTDEGEEANDLKFTNASEMFSNIFTMLFSTYRDADATYAASVSILGQLSQILATLVSVEDRASVVNEFMGNKMNPAERTLHLPFNPEANPATSSVSQLFTPTDVQTVGYTNEDELTLYASLERINFMLSAVYHTFVETGTPEELEARLEELGQKAIGANGGTETEKQEESLKEKLKDIEERLNKYQKDNNLPEIGLKIVNRGE